jgi:protein transport protein SEC24
MPNLGPGALTKRDDGSLLGTAKETTLLEPHVFYKTLSVEFCRTLLGVDVFNFASQYTDIASLDALPHFTGGTLFSYPGFNAGKSAEDGVKFSTELSKHISLSFGYEAVMRVRASKGIRMNSFHGNFFLQQTDLMSLGNVNPGNCYGIQLALDEDLTAPLACFQTALLYTSSVGDRRIRVLTLAIPVSNDVNTLVKNANGPALGNLLSKMAVERAITAQIEDARDALVNKIAEVVQNHAGVILPNSGLRSLALMILSMIKHESIRGGSTTSSDIRSQALSILRSLPLDLSNYVLVPRLYPLHLLAPQHGQYDENGDIVLPMSVKLATESLDRNGLYLLHNGLVIYLYVGLNASPELIQAVFNVPSKDSLSPRKLTLPVLQNPLSQQVANIIRRVRELNSVNYLQLILVKENEPPYRAQFYANLIEDRNETLPNYAQFLISLKTAKI